MLDAPFHQFQPHGSPCDAFRFIHLTDAVFQALQTIFWSQSLKGRPKRQSVVPTEADWNEEIRVFQMDSGEAVTLANQTLHQPAF